MRVESVGIGEIGKCAITFVFTQKPGRVLDRLLVLFEQAYRLLLVGTQQKVLHRPTRKVAQETQKQLVVELVDANRISFRGTIV